MPAITNKTEELIGVYSHTYRCKGPDDSPDRWMVGVMCDGACFEGNAKADFFQQGDKYALLGRKTYDDRFGHRFKFSSASPVEPTDLQSIIRYLQKAKGIGEKAALRIVAEFGELALEELRLNPAGVAKRCSLNVATIETASSFFNQRKSLERITIEVEGLIGNRGFPKSTPQKCIETWGEEASKVIRENPYVLRIFAGVGFLKCDQLYESLGLPMDALTRQSHCALDALESPPKFVRGRPSPYPSGSTWFGMEIIEERLAEKIASAKVKPIEALKDAIGRDMIRHRREDSRSFFAVAALADAESSWVSDVYRAMHEGEDGFGLRGESKWQA